MAPIVLGWGAMRNVVMCGCLVILTAVSAYAESRDSVERACDEGNAAACAHLADLVARGDGGERNWGEAIVLADKACSLAHATSCPQAQQLRVHPPDWRCATADDCKRLCDERLGRACRRLGELRDADADDAYEHGCIAGDMPSCVRRGDRATAFDDASPWYARACKSGDAHACLFTTYGKAHDGATAAITSLRSMCGGHREACVLLGMAVVADRPGEAERVWRDACGRGAAVACRLLGNEIAPAISGEQHATARQLAERDRLLTLACNLGDPVACNETAPFDAPRLPRRMAAPAWQ